jgi:hypothetical protein
MPNIHINNGQEVRHTDDMQDIITKVPSWILRWGITLFFGVLVMTIGLSSLIHYPDTVKSTLKISTPAWYGRVISKSRGKVSKIFVQSDKPVNLGQVLAYVEDTNSNKEILKAPISGVLMFADIIHENDVTTENQELFYINPGNKEFYGKLIIPQSSLGNVHEGQDVLIKLRNYPFAQFGFIRGKIKYISDIADKEGEFMAEVEMKTNVSGMGIVIPLKPGMLADAEIITQDATILQRITRSVIGVVRSK